MIRPPLLLKGNTIGITAPGKKLSADVIQAAEKVIQSWGYQVKLSRSLSSEAHSYLSGSDSERLADLQELLDDRSVDAIICARGGYGTTRILDSLDFSSFIKNPKWICGFSDITALHLKLQRLEVQSIHSIMPVLFSDSESRSSIESLQKILCSESAQLEAGANSMNKEGVGRGELIGGNLSLIVDSLGTNSEIDTTNKILILEEIEEYLYKIDRMIVQLKRAGKFNSLTGLVVGHMTDMKETELPFGEKVEQIFSNQLSEYQFPIGFGFPVGHQSPNLAWVQGAFGTLKVTSNQSSLSF